MKEIEEIKQVYEDRYANRSLNVNHRELVLYKKYNTLIIRKSYNQRSLSCLDLGCGEGDKIIGFASQFESVLAVDLSEKVIEICNQKFNSSNVKFEALNALEIKGKFDVVTAFGFSLFNTSDNTEFLNMLNTFLMNNFSDNKFNTFIIGSFTDFSGGGRGSWYKHTIQDLKEIVGEIEEKSNYKVRVVFPHKLRSNYFGWGVYNFFAEMYKLIFKKNKTFFIILDNG